MGTNYSFGVFIILVLTVTVTVRTQTATHSSTGTTNPIVLIDATTKEEVPHLPESLKSNITSPLRFPQEKNEFNGTRIVNAGSTIQKPNLNKTDVVVNGKINTINSTNSTNKTDTEVPDLLKMTEQKPLGVNEPLAPTHKIDNVPNPIINKETELIEDGHNTEDILRNRNHSQLEKSTYVRPGVPLVQGQLAAILAGVFVIISIIAYVGLLSWRRFLESRYENREMLVNEDELDRDDLRHFSI